MKKGRTRPEAKASRRSSTDHFTTAAMLDQTKRRKAPTGLRLDGARVKYVSRTYNRFPCPAKPETCHLASAEVPLSYSKRPRSKLQALRREILQVSPHSLPWALPTVPCNLRNQYLAPRDLSATIAEAAADLAMKMLMGIALPTDFCCSTREFLNRGKELFVGSNTSRNSQDRLFESSTTVTVVQGQRAAAAFDREPPRPAKRLDHGIATNGMINHKKSRSYLNNPRTNTQASKASYYSSPSTPVGVVFSPAVSSFLPTAAAFSAAATQSITNLKPSLTAGSRSKFVVNDSEAGISSTDSASQCSEASSSQSSAASEDDSLAVLPELDSYVRRALADRQMGARSCSTLQHLVQASTAGSLSVFRQRDAQDIESNSSSLSDSPCQCSSSDDDDDGSTLPTYDDVPPFLLVATEETSVSMSLSESAAVTALPPSRSRQLMAAKAKEPADSALTSSCNVAIQPKPQRNDSWPSVELCRRPPSAHHACSSTMWSFPGPASSNLPSLLPHQYRGSIWHHVSSEPPERRLFRRYEAPPTFSRRRSINTEPKTTEDTMYQTWRGSLLIDSSSAQRRPLAPRRTTARALRIAVPSPGPAARRTQIIAV